MKVLVLIHEYPPIGGGGGRVAQDLCQGLVKRGHQVTLLTAHMPGLARQEFRDGVQVVRIPSLRRQAYKASLPAMGAFILFGLVAAWRLARVWRPDLIHVHFAVPAGALAWALSRLTGIPYVLTAHLGDVPGGVPEKTGRWFRWVFPLTPPIWRQARQVVAVSDFTRQLAQRHYPVDIRVIHNGVDLQALDPGEIRTGQPPQITFAGRFVAQKNPLQVIRTLTGLQDLPWKCVMLGDGVMRPLVQAEIAAQGMQANFYLPGWVTPQEVITEFAHSDILFMPSLSEGLSVVGVQALAMGQVIFASQIGGWIDLVQNGRNGFLFAQDDTAGMQACLRALLADPARLLAMRLESRQLAAAFDLAHIIAEYENLFSEVITR